MKKNLPEFYVEISSPDNKYDVTPIYDTIKTLEGVHAGLPYGSSSGRWGDSGSTWTAQHGTPIGADIIYYSGYEGEDVFYRLNIDFPIDAVKDYMERAYAGIDDLDRETQEYKRLGRGMNLRSETRTTVSVLLFLVLLQKAWWWFGSISALRVSSWVDIRHKKL